MNRASRNLKNIYKVSRKNFSWFSNIKRHFDSLIEPGHAENSSAIQDTNLAFHTHMRQFQAYLTKNAYDMAVNNEYELWPHTNFGTIDNPALIFNSSATWRMVICTGPGSEEESSTHEKMYMIVREGPIHRCIMCGQCFKLVNLKDNIYDPLNSYYSNVFTDVSPKVISQPELMPWIGQPFVTHDLNMNQYNVTPIDRVYFMINADESDHIMTDPAYRLQKYKEHEEYVKKIEIVNNEVNKQRNYISNSDRNKVVIAKDIYETWYQVEKAILKFDRVFNRYEKFVSRALNDPENHERRERRMNERKEERHRHNYTYFFGDLTESEQQYRDYFESDVEDTKDYAFLNNWRDDETLKMTDDFNQEHLEFSESHIIVNKRDSVEDFLGKSLFKYKYRRVADPKYHERNEYVIARSQERLKNSGFKLTEELNDILEKHHVDTKYSFTQLLDKADQVDGLEPFLKFISEESYNQYKDYYDNDPDEQKNFGYFNDLTIREKIRFAEFYENPFNLSNSLESYYVTIPKRPYDNKLSVVSNFVEDLKDFNVRVRPITRNLAFLDASSKFTLINESNNKIEERYKKVLDFKKVGTNFIEQVKGDNKL